jgi:hypothetical protein
MSEDKMNERKAAAIAGLEELFLQKPYVMGEKSWTREDLYERSPRGEQPNVTAKSE